MKRKIHTIPEFNMSDICANNVIFKGKQKNIEFGKENINIKTGIHLCENHLLFSRRIPKIEGNKISKKITLMPIFLIIDFILSTFAFVQNYFDLYNLSSVVVTLIVMLYHFWLYGFIGFIDGLKFLALIRNFMGFIIFLLPIYYIPMIYGIIKRAKINNIISQEIENYSKNKNVDISEAYKDLNPDIDFK